MPLSHTCSHNVESQPLSARITTSQHGCLSLKKQKQNKKTLMLLPASRRRAKTHLRASRLGWKERHVSIYDVAWKHLSSPFCNWYLGSTAQHKGISMCVVIMQKCVKKPAMKGIFLSTKGEIDMWSTYVCLSEDLGAFTSAWDSARTLRVAYSLGITSPPLNTWWSFGHHMAFKWTRSINNFNCINLESWGAKSLEGSCGVLYFDRIWNRNGICPTDMLQ